MKNINTCVYLILIGALFLSSSDKIRIDKHQEQYMGQSPSADLLISRGWVSYKDFGAKGDGQTDDILSISKTHNFANEHNLKVKADKECKYYIGKSNTTVDIQTDTDFGNASFIIDDRDVENLRANVFSVTSKLSPIKITNVQSLKKNQNEIGEFFKETTGLVIAVNSNVKRYIRYGSNQNSGSSQTDVFLISENGEIDSNAPILWNFDEVTDMTFYPIDEDTLTISGGRFTTIANKDSSNYRYYSRGFSISRSNVIVDRLTHYVEGEGETGSPYSGFINISNCANVLVKNSTLTGRKTYQTIGSAGRTVSMGSYDISVGRAVNIAFENCKQINDIHDRTYWGIMGSNYSKNISLDSCIFSRFDAHQGVANATIRNSTLGHQGINAIGSGTLLVENTTISSRNIVNLRSDYGSTWEGEFIIRNCTFNPVGISNGRVNLIGGENMGNHDFGYECFMPQKIIFDNVLINESEHSDKYQGATIFANFNRDMTDQSYVEDYPYSLTKEIVLKDVKTTTGRPIRISDNQYMFKDVLIVADHFKE